MPSQLARACGVRLRHLLVRAAFYPNRVAPWIAHNNVRPHQGLSFSTRMRAAKQNFTAASYALYQKAHGDVANCISEAQRAASGKKINGGYGALLDNKIHFYHAVASIGVPQPRMYGYMTAGDAVALHDGLSSQMAEGDKIVAKPVSGRKGKGIKFIDFHGQSIRDMAESLVSAGVDYIFTEFIKQHSYSSTIFPGSTNTIRIMTMRVKGERAPFIGAAVHRFGASQTGGVDNFSRGGVVAGIDIETGRLTAGGVCDAGGALRFCDRHPDTGAQIRGVEAAHWEAVKQVVLRVAHEMPFLPYVGWDVVVGENGPVILEGNNCPDLDLVQIHFPLKKNENVRRFYESYDVIKRWP